MEQKLGRYIIEDQLGEGSFAWVYRGYDEELERHVALKVLKPIWMSDPQAVARFKQEARTMAKLHHPNIAVVYEVGEAEGQVFLAQFLVNGDTLSTRLKEEGPMTWPQMMEILRPVASALDYAHENGIIHRDIKPANILVDDKGQAYLGDFGLVRAAEGSVQLSASAGGMIGTPAYMAPEQWEDREITPATDVYALSCVVVEILTGKMLFDGSTPATVMKQHLMEGPRFPAQWPEGVPERMVEVLKQGLTEHTADRISSAGALVAALEQLGEIAEEEKETAYLVAPQIWLIDANGHRFDLKLGQNRLGRAKEATIQVEADGISREHARLEFNGEQVMVFDEGSANGTFVNDQLVGPAGVPLVAGDVLRVGNLNFALNTPEVTITPPVYMAPTPTAQSEPAPTPSPTPITAAAPVPGTVPPTSAAAPPTKKSGKPILAIVGAVVVLLVIVGGVGLLLLGDDETEPIEEPAAAVQVAQAEEEPTEVPTPTLEPTEPPAVVAEPTTTSAPEPTEEMAAEPDLNAAELVDRAWASFDAGNIEDAMADFDLAIELEPNNANLYDERGWAYHQNNEFDQALTDIDQAIELDPTVPVFHTDRGVVHNAREEFELAIADFDQALTLEPDDILRADTLMNLGIALEGLGSKEEALATYQEAIDTYQAAGAPKEDYEFIEEWVAALEDELGSAASPEIAAASPTASPTLSPIPQPQPVQAKSGIFNDFESAVSWKRGDQPYGTLERSTANAHNGSSAGRLAYDFPAVNDNFVVFLWEQPLSGKPEQLSAWVNGDESGHYLNAWVEDNAGDLWQFTFGQINHTGWQQMVAPLDPAGKWPVGIISGNSNKTAVEYPVSFQGLALDGVPDGATSSGTIFIDDLTSGTTLTEGPVTDSPGSESATSVNSGQYLLQLGGQHLYQEPWGGDNGDPCRAWETGVFDDTNPNFRGFNVELVLTNNSSSKIPDDWAEDLIFVTANGEEVAACYFAYNGMGPPPGASSSVTFFTVVPRGDYVNLVELSLEDEIIELCLDGEGDTTPC